MMFLYRVFGLNLASELRCPELLETRGAEDARIIIASHKTPEGHAPGFTASTGRFDLVVPKVAAFSVTNGTTITIAPHPGADEAAIRLFLLGTAIGAILHQRGDLPLHGSAICRAGRSVILLGASGAGKSSLAAALARDGWRMQSDDISVVRLYDGIAYCEAGFPRRKMWPDMLRQLGHDPAAHAHVREGIEKRLQLLSADEFHAEPAPIAAVVSLLPSRKTEPELTAVDGPLRMAVLKKQTFRANLRGPLQMHLPHFAIISALASQAPLWRLLRPRSQTSPQVLADFVAPTLNETVGRKEPT